MTESNLSQKELARRGFERYDEDGADGFLEFLEEENALAPDFLCHVQDDLPNGGDWLGIEGFREMTRTWLEPWERFSVSPHEYVEISDQALLVPVRQEAVAKGSGIEIGAEMIFVLLFQDGRISQVRIYAERERAEREAGAWP